MGRIEYESSDMNKLAADLSGAEGRIGPVVKKVVAKITLDVERDAKAAAPVDVGNLKNSIGHSDLRSIGSEGSIEAEVGPTADYGVWVELGTSKMAAQPYLGPALDRHQAPFAQAVAAVAAQAALG